MANFNNPVYVIFVHVLCVLPLAKFYHHAVKVVSHPSVFEVYIVFLCFCVCNVILSCFLIGSDSQSPHKVISSPAQISLVLKVTVKHTPSLKFTRHLIISVRLCTFRKNERFMDSN